MITEFLKGNPEVIHHIFNDDGRFPNNPLPLLIYKGAMELPADQEASASVVEKLFEMNNWKNSWRNGIYDFHHYHSITHEVLGIYSGAAIVQLGGPGGISVSISKGDIIIIPAGVAHKNLEEKNDFKCVGAYPDGKNYDMNYGDKDERPKADENIKNVPLPDLDPLYGNEGPLHKFWKN